MIDYIEITSFIAVFGLTAIGIYADCIIRKKIKLIKQLESELAAEKEKVIQLELQIKNPAKFNVGEVVAGYLIKSKRFRDAEFKVKAFVLGLAITAKLFSKKQKTDEQIENLTQDFIKSQWLYEVEKDGLKGIKSETELLEIINNQNK
jgi:hypothetical protein